MFHGKIVELYIQNMKSGDHLVVMVIFSPFISLSLSYFSIFRQTDELLLCHTLKLWLTSKSRGEPFPSIWLRSHFSNQIQKVRKILQSKL